MNNRFFAAGRLAAALLPFLTVAASAQTNLFPDLLVATGRGIEIRQSVIDDAFVTEKTLAAAQQNVVIPESDRAHVESDILQHMIVNKILVQQATPEEVARVHERVDTYINGLHKAADSEELFQSQIKASGKSLDQIKAGFFEKELARVVLVRELVPSNTVSDEAVRKFYDDPANTTNFMMPEVVHVQHILIAALDPTTLQPLPPDKVREKEKLAEDVQGQAAKGADFDELVKKYSDDTSTKNKGGELAFVRHSLGAGMIGFENAAFTLKTNQISSVVESPYGYHIIKLLGKEPAYKAEFNKVEDVLKEQMTSVEINKRLAAFVPKLFEEYNVKITFPDYTPSSLKLPDAASVTNKSQ